MDFKPLVDFMKEQIAQYGLWRVVAVALVLILAWRLPNIVTALAVLLAAV